MSSKTRAAAQRVVETILLCVRTLHAELRHTECTLAPAHFRLLMILAQHPWNLTELAEAQRVSRPTMSNSISRLVDRGWVKRVRDPQDRRMVLIELTPAGRAVLGDIRHAVETRVTELLAPLSPTECDQVLAGLAVLRSVFVRATGDVACSEKTP